MTQASQDHLLPMPAHAVLRLVDEGALVNLCHSATTHDPFLEDAVAKGAPPSLMRQPDAPSPYGFA